MSLREKQYLLINPWIADVAAFNFWIRPLGLYRLAEWLHERGGSPILVDCLSPSDAPAKFRREPVEQPECLARTGIKRRFCRYGITPQEFRGRIKQAGHVEAVLVTSAMSYWYPGVQWAIHEIRQIYPSVPVILGGVYPTLWPRHAGKMSGADHILCGPLESHEDELAALLGLPAKPVRERRPWYVLGLHDGACWSAVRVAQGCPFGCAYCASRLVSGKYKGRMVSDIQQELEALFEMGVRDVSFYDDALLVDFQTLLKPVLTRLHQRCAGFSFHTPNAMHAALIDLEVAELLRRWRFRTIRIGLETVDRMRQGDSGGKVRSEDVAKAVECFRRAGYRSEEIGVYLLAGLPGQSLEEVREGIEFVRGIGARPYLSELSPIPGTKVWDDLEKMGLVSTDMDPLLTNNSIFCEASGFWSREEFSKLKMLCRAG